MRIKKKMSMLTPMKKSLSTRAKSPQISYKKLTRNELNFLGRMFRQMAQTSPDRHTMSKETLSNFKLPGTRGFSRFSTRKSEEISTSMILSLDYKGFCGDLSRVRRG